MMIPFYKCAATRTINMEKTLLRVFQQDTIRISFILILVIYIVLLIFLLLYMYNSLSHQHLATFGTKMMLKESSQQSE